MLVVKMNFLRVRFRACLMSQSQSHELHGRTPTHGSRAASQLPSALLPPTKESHHPSLQRTPGLASFISARVNARQEGTVLSLDLPWECRDGSSRLEEETASGVGDCGSALRRQEQICRFQSLLGLKADECRLYAEARESCLRRQGHRQQSLPENGGDRLRQESGLCTEGVEDPGEENQSENCENGRQNICLRYLRRGQEES